MPYNINYKMITLAREVRGINQKELAQKVSTLNQGNLSKIERGLLKFSDKALIELAKVLNFPISFFEQETLKASLNEIYYRKQKSVLKKPLKKFEATRDLIVQLIDNLMNDIELPPIAIPILDLEKGNTPEIAARKVRAYLNIPNGPIDNITNYLERNGVIVHLIDIEDDKIEGCTMISDTNSVIIFINEKHPPDRQRFTLLHELGHLVMHLYVDVPKGKRDVENESNRFAAEFLMPERDCLYDLRNLTFSKLPNLKSYWGASYGTIIKRGFYLRTITEKKRKSLYIQRSQAGYIKKEPQCGVKFHKPLLLKKIIDFYMKEMDYDKIELCEMLRINLLDFNKLILCEKNLFKLRIVSK